MTTISARKRIWGWMMFDWATQPFYTVLLTFIFGPYIVEIVASSISGLEPESADARAQVVWSNTQTLIGLFIAFTAPVLGAIADSTGRRIPWIALFSVFSSWAVGAFGGCFPTDQQSHKLCLHSA